VGSLLGACDSWLKEVPRKNNGLPHLCFRPPSLCTTPLACSSLVTASPSTAYASAPFPAAEYAMPTKAHLQGGGRTHRGASGCRHHNRIVLYCTLCQGQPYLSRFGKTCQKQQSVSETLLCCLCQEHYYAVYVKNIILLSMSRTPICSSHLAASQASLRASSCCIKVASAVLWLRPEDVRSCRSFRF